VCTGLSDQEVIKRNLTDDVIKQSFYLENKGLPEKGTEHINPINASEAPTVIIFFQSNHI
jgi:hypothetical protein